MRRLGALLISLAVLVPAASGLADEHVPPIAEYVPTFTRADAWLHGAGSPIGNVDASEGRYLGWDATKPTGDESSVYVGNNAWSFPKDFGIDEEGVGDDHNPAHFLTMVGTAAGDLTNVAFDLYFIGWAQSTVGCPLSLSFQLVVDDVTILDQDMLGSDGIHYEVVDEDAQISRMRFALTNLWEATKLHELPYGPGVEHEIYLNVQNFYLCNEVIWLYDAADTPSGLTVNRPSTAGYTRIDVLDPPAPAAG